MSELSISRLTDIKDYNKNYVINRSKANKDYSLFFYLQYLNQKDSYTKYPKFNNSKSIKFISNGKGLPLLIIVQGFYDKYIPKKNSKSVFSINNINELNDSGLDFAFGGFIKRNSQYNYICIKDNFQSWYTVNFDCYMDEIIKILLDQRPSHIYTLGSSAGGFGAILFGHYLNANISITYAPQILAFHHFMNEYRQILNIKYQLSQLTLTDLSLLQRVNKGFNCNVNITANSGNDVDMNQLRLLEHNKYSDLTLRLLKSKEHNVFSTINKVDEFSRINNLIDNSIN